MTRVGFFCVAQEACEALADDLERKGFDVRMIREPFSAVDLRSPAFEVALVLLTRRSEAIGRPLRDFEREVESAGVWEALAEQDVEVPIVLMPLGLQEIELPTDRSYVAFMPFPNRYGDLCETLERAASAWRKEHPLAPG